MKKTILTILFISLAIGANAQMFDFADNLRRFEVGLNVGQVGTSTPYAGIGVGANLVLSGFHLDFVIDGPDHKYDNHVNNATYDDCESFVINAGYQIPIFRWLRIIPIAGYCQTNEGVTDASTVNIQHNEYSSSIYHDYYVIPGSRRHYFNYGGGISIQPLKWFSINAICTKYAIYGGISIDMLSFGN